MSKKVVGAVVVVALALTPIAAQAQSRGITCKITGSVEVKPGLRAPAPGYYGETYKVKLTGDYTGCHGSPGVPSAGSFTATGKGDGTCVLRNVSGRSSVEWDNGNETTFEFATQDVASANAFTITPTKSNEPAMQKGDHGIGVLKFTGETAKCNTQEGLTEATFEGQITSGSPS